MGFDQENSVRTYRFDRIEKGEPTAHLRIDASLDLFLKNRVAIQDGPVLCAKKLASDLQQVLTGKHTLTDEDLAAFTAARADSAARKADARLRQPRRPAQSRPYAGGASLPSTPYRV
jgi:hypothetical protein